MKSWLPFFFLLLTGLQQVGCTPPLTLDGTSVFATPGSTSPLIEDTVIAPGTVSVTPKMPASATEEEKLATQTTASPLLTTPEPQETPEVFIERVGQIGGVAGPLAILNQYAYLGIGDRLAVIDIIDPSALQVVGYSERLPFLERMTWAENYLYVTGGDGLWVLDLIDLTAPRLVGSIEMPHNHLGNFTVNGSYAYVTAGEAGLLVVDISDPTVPLLVGSLDTPGNAVGVAVAGNYAYVADSDFSYNQGGFVVIDISNPTAPRQVASLPLGKDVQDVAVVENYAYLAAYDENQYGYGLRVLDISNPLHPQQVGQYTNPAITFTYQEVIVAENIVLLSGTFCHFGSGCYYGKEMFDVSDPTNPLEAQAILPGISSNNRSGDLIILNGLEYQTTQTGLEVWNLQSSEEWTKVGEIQLTLGVVKEIAISNGYAYVTDNQHNLTIMNVSDSANPVKVGEMVIPQHSDHVGVTGAVVKGDYAYIAQYEGLSIINVSDPSQPYEISFLSLPGERDEVNVVDNYLYIRGFSEDIQKRVTFVVDISDPTHPREVGFLPPESNLLRLVKVDNYIYALIGNCDQSGGCRFELRVFDALPSQEIQNVVGSLSLPDDTSDIFVVGESIYVVRCQHIDSTCTSALWTVVDISNPTQPQSVEVVTFPEYEWENTYDESVQYFYWGQRVIDVSTPTQPRGVGTSPYLQGKKVAQDGYIYVAGGETGLLILQVSPVTTSNP